MKNLLLIIAAMMFINISFAQEEVDKEMVQLQGNEFAVNTLDLVTGGAIEMQYERFLDNNHSGQISFTAFDNYGYYDLDMIDKNQTHSIAAAYKFYMGKKDHAGIFFYPYAKYMFGTLTQEGYYYEDGSSNDYEIDMDNLSLGFGLGYKWVFSKNYALGLDVSLGRTFNDDISDYYSSVEFKSGVSLGYRF